MKKILSIILALVIALSAAVIAPVSFGAVQIDDLASMGATRDEAPAGTAEPVNLTDDGFYAHIIQASSGKYITSDGANVYLNSYANADASKETLWRFDKLTDDVFTLTNYRYGTRMDILNGMNADGTNVQLWDANAATAQMWRLINSGVVNGLQTYLFVPMCATSTALDIAGGSVADGTNVQIRRQNGSAAQQLAIVYPAAPYPEITSIKNSRTGQTIGWTDTCSKAASYRVFIKSGDKWVKLADTKDRTYLNTSVKSNVTYTYTVRGLDKKGKLIGAYDHTGVSKKFYATPVVKLTNTAKGVKITWAAVKGAKYYCVFRKNADTDWDPIGVTEKCAWTNTKVESGKKYSYTVRVADKNNNVLSAGKGKDITFITAPKISKIAFSKKGHVIKWKKSKGAVKYRVFVKSGSKWNKLGDTAKASFTYKNAKVGVKYTYAVRCISKNGKSYTSALGASKSFKSLKAPTGIKLEKYGSSIQIDWNKRGGTQKYRIYYRFKSSDGKSSWTEWYELGDREQSDYVHYSFYDPYGGRKYQFGIRCITNDGTALSAMATSSTMRYAQAPYIYESRYLICPNADDYVSFSWNSVPGAYRYRIYMWQDDKWKKMTEQYSRTYYYYTYPYGTFRFAVRAIDSEGHNLSILRTIRMEQRGRNGGTYYTSLEYK